jgi:hypothetical protein
MSQNNAESFKAAGTGIIASIGTWVLGAIKWYAHNLPMLTEWLVHFAQIGGLVIVILSIRILRRNIKNGKNSIDPKA